MRNERMLIGMRSMRARRPIRRCKAQNKRVGESEAKKKREDGRNRCKRACKRARTKRKQRSVSGERLQ
jgi:hypothetical protein